MKGISAKEIISSPLFKLKMKAALKFPLFARGRKQPAALPPPLPGCRDAPAGQGARMQAVRCLNEPHCHGLCGEIEGKGQAERDK